MKNVITLAIIAAGTLSAAQAEIPAGTTLADLPDELADQLIDAGQARLATDPVTEAKPKGKAVQVRVLVDCAAGKANDVASLPPDQAKAMERAGQVDTDKAAVAYALSLRAAQ
jgi:hypothetical protein